MMIFAMFGTEIMILPDSFSAGMHLRKTASGLRRCSRTSANKM